MNLNQKGIAPIVVAIIVIIVLIIGIAIGYFINKFYIVEQPTTPQGGQTTTPPPTDETTNWKTYRNDGIGIQFKYPGDGEIENTIFIDKKIGPISVKAFPIGRGGPYTTNPYEENNIEEQKNEKYYKDFFLSIKDYPQNQECNNLEYIPVFQKSNLGKSCRIISSDSGVKIITGFYTNIHGEPPKVAFFITDKYWIELLLHYYNGESTSFDLNSDNFIQEIQVGKYKNITKQIDVFDKILKTVEFIK